MQSETMYHDSIQVEYNMKLNIVFYLILHCIALYSGKVKYNGVYYNMKNTGQISSSIIEYSVIQVKRYSIV